MICTYSSTVIRSLPRNCSWLRNCLLLEPPLRSGNPDCTDPILASIPNIMPICSGYATSREVGDKTGYTNHYARTAEQDNWWPFLACWGRVKVVVTIHGLKVFTCREIWYPSIRLLLLAVCICQTRHLYSSWKMSSISTRWEYQILPKGTKKDSASKIVPPKNLPILVGISFPQIFGCQDGGDNHCGSNESFRWSTGNLLGWYCWRPRLAWLGFLFAGGENGEIFWEEHLRTDHPGKTHETCCDSFRIRPQIPSFSV